MDVLAPDVVLLTDGGGVKKAALRPIHGRDKVTRSSTRSCRRASSPTRSSSTAARRCGSRSTARSDAVASLLVEDGRVTGCTWCATRQSWAGWTGWSRSTPVRL
jgi:RNA polymerase sigma-70 factor (ECF subfamily)